MTPELADRIDQNFDDVMTEALEMIDHFTMQNKTDHVPEVRRGSLSLPDRRRERDADKAWPSRLNEPFRPSCTVFRKLL